MVHRTRKNHWRAMDTCNWPLHPLQWEAPASAIALGSALFRTSSAPIHPNISAQGVPLPGHRVCLPAPSSSLFQVSNHSSLLYQRTFPWPPHFTPSSNLPITCSNHPMFLQLTALMKAATLDCVIIWLMVVSLTKQQVSRGRDPCQSKLSSLPLRQ